MHVLVTGTTGFIGSHLVPDLMAMGHTVVASDFVALPEGTAADERVTCLQADLMDVGHVSGLFSGRRVDCVFQLAALRKEKSEVARAHGYRVNAMATLSLPDASVPAKGEGFVKTSKPAVFGQGLPEPVADDANKISETVYGQTRPASGHILDGSQRKRRLRVRALRFPWVHRPGRVNGITADHATKLLDTSALNEEIIVSTPEAVGDWPCVKDAVKALLLLTEGPGGAPGATDNDMNEVHSVADAMAIGPDVSPDVCVTIRRDDAFHYPCAASFDGTRARQDIGWSQDYPIRRGSNDQFETVRKQREAA